MDNKKYTRLLCSCLLVLLALISCFYIGDYASSVNTHTATIASLDEKVDTVLALSASSATASAVISAFPDDTATPIADKLAEFTQYFLLILCVLYTEKYCITIIGLLSFRILIPLACIFAVAAIYKPGTVWRQLAIRVAAFAIAIYFVIPTGVNVSDLVYNTYSDSINNTVTAADQFNIEENNSSTDEETETTTDGNVLNSFLSSVSETASGLVARASDTLQRFVETLAIMIVTSCLIPLLVLLIFLWAVKTVTGIDPKIAIPIPLKDLRKALAPQPEDSKEKT